MNKGPCYPSDRVCVVLCMSPIVSASCESGSESSSWLPLRLWQDVPPTRRADVHASVWVLAFRGVLFFVWEWVCVRAELRLYPPTSTSACLCDLLQPSASLSGYCNFIHSHFCFNMRPWHILRSCAYTYEHLFVCLCVHVHESECIPIYISQRAA